MEDIMLIETDDWYEIDMDENAVVAFTATWCQPCKALKPQIGIAANKDSDRNYYIVDVDKIDPTVLESFHVRSVPQVYLVDYGVGVRSISARTAAGIVSQAQGE